MEIPTQSGKAQNKNERQAKTQREAEAFACIKERLSRWEILADETHPMPKAATPAPPVAAPLPPAPSAPPVPAVTGPVYSADNTLLSANGSRTVRRTLEKHAAAAAPGIVRPYVPPPSPSEGAVKIPVFSTLNTVFAPGEAPPARPVPPRRPFPFIVLLITAILAMVVVLMRL